MTVSQRVRPALIRLLPWLTAAWVFVELLSLRLPLLRPFFFDTAHADVQGIDYYSLPKAWLNLAQGRSAYGTFDPPTFGPHFTWYLAHPLLAVTLGWPLSRLDPADSYGVFTLFSLGLMALSAFLLARETASPFAKRLIWLLLLGGFPTFDMLFVGNVQSVTVLGLTLTFAALIRFVRVQVGAHRMLILGLLICLFSKPVIFSALLLLILVHRTRRATLDALGIYLPCSLLFLLVPALNPEHTSLRRVLFLALHPQVVRSTMNIYANHLQLTPDMRDNSIHWFNLVAQSGFRLEHVDVYSLPVFLDSLLGHHTPTWLYLFPSLAVLALSFAVPRLPEGRQRLEATLLLTLAASLDFFLTYPTVWEYQYTAVFPVAGALLVLGPTPIFSARLRRWCLGLAGIVALPSLYFLSDSATPSRSVLALTRLDRVLPVTALFWLLIWAVFQAVRAAARHAGTPADAPPTLSTASS